MDKKCDGKDYLVLGSVDETGGRRCVIHRADHRIEQGRVFPLRDGQPVQHALVVNAPDEHGRLEVVAEIITNGPPKVVSNKYREGWDRIFGAPEEPSDDITSMMINPCCHYGPDLDPKDMN